METLNAVYYRCENNHRWHGQFLQMDVGASADNLENLNYEMQRALVSFVAMHKARGQDPFDRPQAPHQYWEMFKHSQNSATPLGDVLPWKVPESLPWSVPKVEARLAEVAC